MQHWKNGEIALAAEEFGKLAEKAKAKDHIIWNLEYATALRNNNSPKHSLEVFQIAENKVEEYENKAEVSVLNEAGAAISNQANLPYRGQSHDKVMLSTYMALNRLAIGDYIGARVELNRAHDRQRLALEENARRLEKAKEDAESKKFS